MNDKTLFNSLVNEYKLGYAILSSDLIVTDCNELFLNFIHPAKSPKGKTIYTLVEETIGLEDNIKSLLKSPNQNVTLNNINRDTEHNETNYYNLKIMASGDITLPLIFFVQNVTDNTNLYRINLQQKREIQLLESMLSAKKNFLVGSILGDSKPIIKVREMVSKISILPNTTVLLQGNSGTGKSLVARVIHYNNRSDKKPFVEINCAAIPENLLESELFGYEKGAFTNAISDKAGLLEEANGGTLFLDEISEMPLKLQSKLLTFLETKRFRRLGSTIEIEVKVRFITATNKHLPELVKKGDFREDLFFRLNVVELKLPSLKEMGKDVIIIANHFIKVYNHEFKKSVAGLTKNAESKLMSHPWPGNVRELGNCLERSMIFCDEKVLDAQDLLIQDMNNISEFEFPHSGVQLEELEKQYIQSALKIAQGNKTKAAQLLGLSRDTLRYRIDKHNIIIEI